MIKVRLEFIFHQNLLFEKVENIINIISKSKSIPRQVKSEVSGRYLHIQKSARKTTVRQKPYSESEYNFYR